MTQRPELEKGTLELPNGIFGIAGLGFKIQLNLDSQLQAKASVQWLPETALLDFSDIRAKKETKQNKTKDREIF